MSRGWAEGRGMCMFLFTFTPLSGTQGARTLIPCLRSEGESRLGGGGRTFPSVYHVEEKSLLERGVLPFLLFFWDASA